MTAGQDYIITGKLFTHSVVTGANGGIKLSFGATGGLTLDAMRAEMKVASGPGINFSSQGTALGAVFGGLVPSDSVEIWGWFSCSVSGSIFLAAAQVAADGANPLSVLTGSFLQVGQVA
jgi:hypothetical protein